MIKLHYGNNPLALANSYASQFTSLQSEWERIRNILIGLDADFENILLKDIEKFLVLDFALLIDIYDKFTSLSSIITQDLKDQCKFLFAYDRIEYNGKSSKKHHDKIAKFFMKNADVMQLHTCHYCDMAYINCFTEDLGSGKMYNHFDLDHILDKGECPILALSFFNLVPVCPVCNERMKSKKQYEATKEERAQLSPTSEEYRFDEDVTIWVNNIHGQCCTFDYQNRMNDYEIKFDTSKAPIYEKEIEMFKLVPRYNYHKAEALRLMDLNERYTDSKIIEMARLIMGDDDSKDASNASIAVINQIKTDIFASDFVSEQHRTFGKLHRDIMKK